MSSLLALLLAAGAAHPAPFVFDDLSRRLVASELPADVLIAVEEDNPSTHLLRRLQVTRTAQQLRVQVAAWKDQVLLGSSVREVKPEEWARVEAQLSAESPEKLADWLPAQRYEDQSVTTVALPGRIPFRAWTPSESAPGRVVHAVEALAGIDPLVRRWLAQRRSGGLALEELNRSPFEGPVPEDLRLLLEHQDEDGGVERLALFENAVGQLRLQVVRADPNGAGRRTVRTLPIELSRVVISQLAASALWTLDAQKHEFLLSKPRPERLEVLIRDGRKEHRFTAVGGVSGAHFRAVRELGEIAVRATDLLPADWVRETGALQLLERAPHWSQAAIDPEVAVLLVAGSVDALSETRWEVRMLPGGTARVTRVAFGRGSERPVVKERRLSAAELDSLWSGLDRLGWSHLVDVRGAGTGDELGQLIFLRRGPVVNHLSVYAPIPGSAHDRLVALLTGLL